jgi:uncharacterized protein (TIGR03067 family)
MKRTTLLLAVVFLAGAADGAKDESAKDLEKMQGDWAADSLVRGGFPLPADDARAYFRTVKDDQYTVSRYSKVVGKGTFKIDATKKPKTIDSQPADPTGKIKPVLGIYELDGDKLTICNAEPGKERPTEFTSKEGSGNSLTVWLREKK